jgi:hypothetical protein
MRAGAEVVGKQEMGGPVWGPTLGKLGIVSEQRRARIQ